MQRPGFLVDVRTVITVTCEAAPGDTIEEAARDAIEQARLYGVTVTLIFNPFHLSVKPTSTVSGIASHLQALRNKASPTSDLQPRRSNP